MPFDDLRGPGGGGGTLIERIGRTRERAEERRYELTGKARRQRLREIVGILKRAGALKGEMTPVKFRRILEELGPTFVKVGQILSMRSEILPQRYCDELAKLRADVEPMPLDTVVAALEEEYQRPLDEVFAEFDARPLGSASVAQVHRARLITGEDVAVKVQRPGVQKTMARDIDLMRRLCRYLRVFWKNDQILDLDQTVEELWSAFVEETDFLVEARNLREFHAFNRHCVYVDCPKPYLEWCTEHIVVMDYVEGISIEDPGKLEAAGYDLEEIGTKLVDNYATQVLDDGFFHADPHPGNIIINGGKIVYIDLGMTGRLSAHGRSCMSDIILAVGMRDSHRLLDALLRFSSAYSPQIDRAALLSELDGIVSEFGGTDLQDLDLGQMAMALIAMARRNKVELPAAVTMMARGLVTLEGVLGAYVPHTSMIQIIREHIESQASVEDMARDEVRTLASEARAAVHGQLKMTAEAGEAMRMLTRGHLKMNMQMLDSPEAFGRLAHILNRLTIGVIIAGLYIGSSVVYYAGIQPVIFGVPVLGFLGYVGAAILSIWVIVDIVRDRRRRG